MDSKFPHHPLMPSGGNHGRKARCEHRGRRPVWQARVLCKVWGECPYGLEVPPPPADAELNMLRKTMGAAMPLKLSMERKAASKVGHLPCLSAGRSMASLEALTGADMAIGFDDVYGKAEDFEMLPPLPFNAIQKTLDEF